LDCLCDRELTLLHAITETALLFVDHNDLLDPNGLFHLAEGFGIPLAAIAPYGAPDECTGGEPGGYFRAGAADSEMSRQRLTDSVLPTLQDIIGRLDVITDSPDPFVVYLVPSETGLAGDLEIDYGDVLLFKGLLLAYKGLLAAAEIPGVDVGPADANAAAALRDLGLYRAQMDLGLRDPLVTMLSGIEQVDAGGEFLAQARRDWVAALTCYLDAVESIVSEDDPSGSDPQMDELVYMDSEAPRVAIYRDALARLRSRLLEGANGAAGLPVMRVYDVYDANAARLGELRLVFDCTGAEGRAGCLVLSDERSLEVEWFCLFEEGDVGVSLFSRQGQEAWLEGDVHHAGRAIVNAALELWGATVPTMEAAAPNIDMSISGALKPCDLPSAYAQVLAAGLGGTFDAWPQLGMVSLPPQ
jgi:hypothetical protein